MEMSQAIFMAAKAIGAAIAILCAAASSIGEGQLCTKAIEGMARNPEMYGKLRSSMIFGCALVETCGIYALLVSLLILFAL